MKVLICCENFYPSVGGVQEVIYQLSTRLINTNRKVTVATSFRTDRKSTSYKKILIKEFSVSGNYVLGMKGEVEHYRNFIINSNFDYIFIYAAQQWTLDCLIDVFDSIKTKIIFVPCGFSALGNVFYKNYYNKLKNLIGNIHHIVFHTKYYQDYEFLKKKLIKNKYSIIPNGADLKEFGKMKSQNFYKQKFKHSLDNFIILSNSSLYHNKGHLSLLKIINKMPRNKKIIVYINANYPNDSVNDLFSIIISFAKFFFRIFYYREIKLPPSIIILLIKLKAHQLNFFKNITVKQVNFSRDKLIELYKASDLFIFTSKVEYCPLVIYESMASNTAFVSSNVGNVKSIVDKFDCGLISKTFFNKGLNRIDHQDLSKNVNLLINNDLYRKKKAANGRKAFLKNFNWDRIFLKYEKLFK